jgi:iron complex transport system substrate-binding protein
VSTILSLLLVLIFNCNCAFATALQVTDDSGRQLKLNSPAQRIVSLSPHTTELLFAAGAGEQVVGVTSFSDYPPAARQRPEIGGSESLNLEAIIALKPDLVVAWKSGNIAPQVERLIKLGIPVFYSEPRRLEDIATNLQRLGMIAGTSQVAEPAAQAFRERYRQIARQFSQQMPVRTFYQIWHQPLMTINGEHLISQVIEMCGGRNVFASLDTLAPVVNREAVLAADPQIIIASGRATERPEWLSDWQAWPQVSAVQTHQLYFIEPDLIQRQTPRILDGANVMCRQLAQARNALEADGAAQQSD